MRRRVAITCAVAGGLALVTEVGSLGAPEVEAADLPEWGCGCGGITSPDLRPVMLLLLWLRPRRRG